MSGVVVRWLVDPGRAPSGADLPEALRTMVASVRDAEEASDERGERGTHGVGSCARGDTRG